MLLAGAFFRLDREDAVRAGTRCEAKADALFREFTRLTCAAMRLQGLSTRSRFSILVFSTLIVGCGSDRVTGPNDANAPNSVHLQSDAGDYIGAGKTWDYTSSNAIITVSSSGALLTVNVQGDETWRGDFQLPNTLNTLQTGTYTNLQRYPFNNAQQGGLSWEGDGRGCNTLTATLVIDKVTYNGSTLSAIDLHFDQHCEGVAAALHGTIHWRADDATKVAGPVNPIPGSLWRPNASLPTSGNYVYLASDVGDYIGQGGTYLYSSGNSTLTIGASGGHLNVIVNSYDWDGDFQVMNSITAFQQGYYPNLERYPFNNPVRGGLSWSGMGRGCNTLTGWFAVDAVSYNGTSLTSIDLRFEQHCDGQTPALHGVIHWHA